MFTTTASAKLDDGRRPLAPDQAWRGLQIRARNGDDRFVPPGHRFEIVSDDGDGLLRKVYLADGDEEMQRITFHGERLVVFDFVEGPQRGLILCLLETDEDGGHWLRMTFLTDLTQVEHNSDEEVEFAAARRPFLLGEPARVLEVIRQLVDEGAV